MIRILHLSDPHFGASDAAVEKAFIERVRHMQPDHTILSGDLTMRARRREYDESRRFIAELPRPFLVIPGNHDVPALNQPLDRFFNPFRRYRKLIEPDLEPTFNDQRLQILSLNSTRAFGLHADWSDGFLSQGQLDRVTTEFKNGNPSAFRILVLHHPLLAPAGRQRALVKPLPDLLQTVTLSKIDLVLCGHFHTSQIATGGVLDGWKCVVSQAPTVCSTRLQGEPQGFHEILLAREKMTIIHHQFHEREFIPVTEFGFSRTESGWLDCAFQQSGEVVSLG